MQEKARQQMTAAVTGENPASLRSARVWRVQIKCKCKAARQYCPCQFCCEAGHNQKLRWS